MGEKWYSKKSMLADTDFIGFTFNGIHSSDYNIVRVSDGSRFYENLLPDFEDVTQAKSSANGTYYFGNNYTKRTLDIDIAYDSLTETKLRELKLWLSSTEPALLIFDELPYKAYYAKVANNPRISYICFFEDEQRIYKGEGTVSFVIYEAYATLPFDIVTSQIASSISEHPNFKLSYRKYKKFLTHYTDSNRSQWAESSKMNPSDQEIYVEASGNRVFILDQYSNKLNGTIELYNPGDTDVPFKIYFKRNPMSGTGKIINCNSVSLVKMDDLRLTETKTLGTLKFDFSMDLATSLAYKSEYFVLNSNNRLIEGYNSSNLKTGDVLNKYIIQGDFFNIPPGKSRLKFVGGADIVLAFEYPYYYL